MHGARCCLAHCPRGAVTIRSASGRAQRCGGALHEPIQRPIVLERAPGLAPATTDWRSPQRVAAGSVHAGGQRVSGLGLGRLRCLGIRLRLGTLVLRRRAGGSPASMSSRRCSLRQCPTCRVPSCRSRRSTCLPRARSRPPGGWQWRRCAAPSRAHRTWSSSLRAASRPASHASCAWATRRQRRG